MAKRLRELEAENRKLKHILSVEVQVRWDDRVGEGELEAEAIHRRTDHRAVRTILPRNSMQSSTWGEVRLTNDGRSRAKRMALRDHP